MKWPFLSVSPEITVGKTVTFLKKQTSSLGRISHEIQREKSMLE